MLIYILNVNDILNTSSLP